MKPTGYTKINQDKTIFHYKYSDLKTFLKNRKIGGGAILTIREKDFFIYRFFNEYDNGEIHLIKLSIQHDPLFDGKMRTDEQIFQQLITK